MNFHAFHSLTSIFVLFFINLLPCLFITGKSNKRLVSWWGLGTRNELGTRVFDFKGGEQDSVVWGYMGTMRRTTSLGREASLRLEMRIMSEQFQRLKRAGVFKNLCGTAPEASAYTVHTM